MPAPPADALSVMSAMSGCDLLVVTDFASVPRHAARFSRAIAAGRIVREGNLFVRAEAGVR